MAFPLIKLCSQGGQIGFVELVKFFYVGAPVVVLFSESLLGLGEVVASLGSVAFLGMGFGEPVHEVGIVVFEGEAGLKGLDGGGGLAHTEVGDAAEEEGFGGDVFETGDARLVLNVLVEIANSGFVLPQLEVADATHEVDADGLGVIDHAGGDGVEAIEVGEGALVVVVEIEVEVAAPTGPAEGVEVGGFAVVVREGRGDTALEVGYADLAVDQGVVGVQHAGFFEEQLATGGALVVIADAVGEGLGQGDLFLRGERFFVPLLALLATRGKQDDHQERKDEEGVFVVNHGNFLEPHKAPKGT